MNITRKFLRQNGNYYLVYGDNLQRRGHGGAALLRDEPNTYGFITKKEPNNNSNSFYTVEEYIPVFQEELNKLIEQIELYYFDRIYMISKLGAGLANRHKIWENVIQPGLEQLKKYKNVMFLYEI